MSGKHIPKDRLRTLRKSLADNAKAIMKPVSPVKEKTVNVNNPTAHKIAKIVLVAAVTTAAASAIFVAGSMAAFRVPKDLRKFMPEKND
jgi:L-asparagine transporter-like permease